MSFPEGLDKACPIGMVHEFLSVLKIFNDYRLFLYNLGTV